MSGFFEIGIYRGKSPLNVGTLWRSAYQLGAAGIFTIGQRYPQHATDTVKAYQHVPCREYLDPEAFFAALPYDTVPVIVEMGGQPLPDFKHPKRAVYVLGAEDTGVPDGFMIRAQARVISIPSIRTESFNVAVAGSIVMYDRLAKAR